MDWTGRNPEVETKDETLALTFDLIASSVCEGYIFSHKPCFSEVSLPPTRDVQES